MRDRANDDLRQVESIRPSIVSSRVQSVHEAVILYYAALV